MKKRPPKQEVFFCRSGATLATGVLIYLYVNYSIENEKMLYYFWRSPLIRWKGGEGVLVSLERFAIAVLAGVVANAIWHLITG